MRKVNSSRKIWLVSLVVIIIILGGIKLSITYFIKDYNNHLSANVYQKTVIDRNVNLVFYKPGCPYCMAGKQATIKAAKNSPYPTFYINISTKEGQKLVKHYGVTKSATIIRIREGDSRSYYYAKKTKTGDKIADYKSIKAAFKK